MGSQSEEMIKQHNEDEAVNHFANALADEFKDSGELANIDDKRLIVIAYWEGYEHAKRLYNPNPKLCIHAIGER